MSDLSAWCDESMLGRGLESFYILASVLGREDECHATRADLQSLQIGKKKIHWRDENRLRRKRLIDCVCGTGLEGIVIVAAPMDPRRQERARSKCLEQLLHHLAGRNVRTVHLEQRTQTLNSRDMRTVDRLRGRQAIPPTTRVELGKPSVEPMLWLPDIVAGAINADLAGEPRWLDPIRAQITQIQLKLD